MTAHPCCANGMAILFCRSAYPSCPDAAKTIIMGISSGIRRNGRMAPSADRCEDSEGDETEDVTSDEDVADRDAGSNAIASSELNIESVEEDGEDGNNTFARHITLPSNTGRASTISGWSRIKTFSYVRLHFITPETPSTEIQSIASLENLASLLTHTHTRTHTHTHSYYVFTQRKRDRKQHTRTHFLFLLSFILSLSFSRSLTFSSSLFASFETTFSVSLWE